MVPKTVNGSLGSASLSLSKNPASSAAGRGRHQALSACSVRLGSARVSSRN